MRDQATRCFNPQSCYHNSEGDVPYAPLYLACYQCIPKDDSIPLYPFFIHRVAPQAGC